MTVDLDTGVGIKAETFVFEPAQAYSERLTKSIDGLWKLKEVFELGAPHSGPILGNAVAN